MKNTLRLALVIIKGNGLGGMGSDAKGKKRRLSRIGNIILFTVLGIYMTGLVVAGSAFLYGSLEQVGQQSIMIGFFLNTGVLLVFIFGIFYAMSIFYYASDVEKLLPMPLGAEQIIGAKLIVTAVYEYLYIFILVLPALLVYGIRSGAGPLFYLLSLIVILVVPVIPLCFASLLSMLIMRFTKFARNKDRFNLFAGILVMVLAMGFVSSQSMLSAATSDVAGLISQRAGDMARITGSIFPGTSFGAAALTEPNGLLALGWLGLMILIAAAVLVVTMALSRLLYFKGVIGISASTAKRRRLTTRELADAGQGGSGFWTYVWKDLRILFRTPIFFMNNIMMNFLWPVFILMPFIMGGQDRASKQLSAMLQSLEFSLNSPAIPIALAVTFGFACFITGTNGIAESALSREGKLLYIMKILPMSYYKQIWAKLTAGIIMSLCGTLLIVIIAVIFVQPPLWLVLLLLATLPGAILLVNLTGIIFELYWPKLNWDNEQKAVKQNLNVLYGIVLSMLLAALVIVPVIAFSLSIVPAVLLICVVPLLLSCGLAMIIRRIAPRLIRQIDI